MKKISYNYEHTNYKHFLELLFLFFRFEKWKGFFLCLKICKTNFENKDEFFQQMEELFLYTKYT